MTGLDPAAASLAVARQKPRADGVRWIEASAVDAPPLEVDLVTMTGNVAQVFVSDEEWTSVLRAAWHALRTGGHLVFETRNPERRAWETWNEQSTRRRLDTDGAGQVETWTELTSVSLPLVSFRHMFRFNSDVATLTSDSTLRFRTGPRSLRIWRRWASGSTTCAMRPTGPVSSARQATDQDQAA